MTQHCQYIIEVRTCYPNYVIIIVGVLLFISIILIKLRIVTAIVCMRMYSSVESRQGSQDTESTVYYIIYGSYLIYIQP